MNKKLVSFVVICSLVLGGLGGWIFIRYIIPKLDSIQFLVKYNLAPRTAPLVINTREEIRVNEGSDSIAAIQSAKPWVVAIVSGTDQQHFQVNGAGLVLTSDGLIATTKQALPSGTFYVQTSDGTVYPATLKAQDSATNMVFIKVDARNLATASFGAPKNLQLGQRIIALWTLPEEYQAADSVSFISSELRTLSTSQIYSTESISRTFGIDGAVDNLPEGAAVISLDGSVQEIFSKAGIITSDAIQSGFSSYSSSQNKISRVLIGIHYQYISKPLAQLFGGNEGVLVKRPNFSTPAVVPGSPAAQAGILEGDLITKVNGTQINFDNSFEELVSQNGANKNYQLTVVRNKTEKTINIEAGAK